MADLGNEIARRRNLAMKVWAEADRRTALVGADFVVTCFSVGGFDSMRHDLEIPERYGIVQPIGDSVGPGGVTRALRSIPVLLDIARDVDDIAPGAYLLNVTNPLTALCRSVTRETNCRTIGLCNEWVTTTFMLSLLFDSGMREIDAVLGGVNHFPMAMALSVGRDDGFARLQALLDDPEGTAASPLWMDPPEELGWERAGDQWSKADVLANNAVRVELFKRFGVLTCSGDHHATEFVPGFVHAGNDYGKAWHVHVYRLAKHMADAEADVTKYASIRDADDVPDMPSGELVAPLIEAIVTGRARQPSRQPPQRGQRDEPARRRGRRDHGHRRRGRSDRPRHHDRAERDGGVAAPRAHVAGADGRSRAHRRSRARVRSDAHRPVVRRAQLRRRRRDDRRSAHGHGSRGSRSSPTLEGRWHRASS